MSCGWFAKPGPDVRETCSARLCNQRFASCSARVCNLRGFSFTRTRNAFATASVASVRRQQVVEQRNRGVRVDGGAPPE